MAGYADLDECKRQLGLDDLDPDDAAAIVRVGNLDERLSRAFDVLIQPPDSQRTPRWSGTAPDETVRTVWSPLDGPTLFLPVPAVTVASVNEGGTWGGTAWDGQTTLDAEDFYPVHGDAARGFWGLRRADGSGWTAPVLVEAAWADAPGGDPPDVVVEALTFLVVQHYREDGMSPAGVVGPDGMQVVTRNPWKYGRVTEAVEAYRIRPWAVAL